MPAASRRELTAKLWEAGRLDPQGAVLLAHVVGCAQEEGVEIPADMPVDTADHVWAAVRHVQWLRYRHRLGGRTV